MTVLKCHHRLLEEDNTAKQHSNMSQWIFLPNLARHGNKGWQLLCSFFFIRNYINHHNYPSNYPPKERRGLRSQCETQGYDSLGGWRWLITTSFPRDGNGRMCCIQHQRKHEDEISPKCVFNTFPLSCRVLWSACRWVTLSINAEVEPW